MATVSDAVMALIPDEQWVLTGEPTNESEFNSQFSRVLGTDEHGLAILTRNPDNFGVSWGAVSAKMKELNAAEPLKMLREERNTRLAETDWWASSDLTMSAERASYRQYLRDITKTYSSLDDVVWPDKPE